MSLSPLTLPVLHQPAQGPRHRRQGPTEHHFYPGSRRGGGHPQCPGGQVQQCHDALRHGATAGFHLPQLLPALVGDLRVKVQRSRGQRAHDRTSVRARVWIRDLRLLKCHETKMHWHTYI